MRTYVRRNKTDGADAACALANKLARICHATLRDMERFDEEGPVRKRMQRQAFAMPA